MAQPISLACNTFTSLTATSPSSASLSVEVSTFPVGVPPFAVTTDSYLNKNNLINANTTDAATKNLLAITGTHWIEVRNGSATPYPGGSFAGFVVDNNELVDVFSAITITTYLDDTEQDEFSGGSLLSTSLLGSDRGLIGFVTSADKPFNRIRFTYSSAISLGSISVYYAVVKQFCANNTELACNTPTILDQAIYPVAINPANTGISTNLVCALCGIDNPGNVIDNSSATSAIITTAAGVSTTASIGVKNQLQTYPASTFVGFDVETQSLLSVDLVANTTITLYNNGSAVQTVSGSSLFLGAASSALTGNTRQTIGIVATTDFDEAKISFIKTAGVDLSITRVYSAIVQRACEATLACNTTYPLTNPIFPSVINAQRTGVTGAVCALCAVNNPGNLTNASLNDFATLTSIANVGAQSSISVLNPISTYPAGSYAGFVINRPVTVVDLALLGNITITTYNNGIIAESKTSGNLLDLTLLFDIFGAENNTTFNIGFETTKPFDEMQISVGALGGVNQTVNVYSAFIDTRTAFGGNLRCFKANPDFAVTLKSVPVSGSVKTNDIAGTGTTYSAPSGPVSSPGGSAPSLTVNPDGTYSFSSTTAGVYVYQVTVCPPSQTTACPTSLFTITVLDPTIPNNPPVANLDYAVVQGAPTSPGSVTVDITANDGPGNIGGMLTAPTISVMPTNGTASIDPGTGKLIYTPTAGYFGLDILTYQVCESPGGLCATAQVTLTVTDPGSSTVTIIDDYESTAQNIPISGSVLTNDLGTGLSVSNPGTITVSGKGTLILNATGTYTFTPVANVTGPVNFTYTACDNSTTAVCGTATLHLLVVPASDLTPILYARPSPVNGTKNITVVVDVLELNSVTTNGPIIVLVAKDAKINLTFPSSATLVDNRPVQNSAWTFDANTNMNYYVLRTTQPIAAGQQLSFGLNGTLTPGGTAGTLPISAVIIANSGGEAKVTNNVDADKINYFQQ